MKAVPVIRGSVSTNGRLQFTADERRGLDMWLLTLVGKAVDITVKVHRETRSLAQNAWIWGLAYPLLADKFGYDADEIEDLHYGLVAKWGGMHHDARCGMEVPNVRSSKMTTAQFSDYMEWLVRFGAKEGVIIPLPGEADAVYETEQVEVAE